MLDQVQNPVRVRLEAIRNSGGKALCPFVIAGDPTPEISRDLVDVAVSAGADVLEYCLPFDNSITDGPVIKRGYSRAMQAGTDLERAFQLMEQAAAKAPVVCLADYRATVRPMGVDRFLARVAAHGAGAVLVHGLPPLMQRDLRQAVTEIGLGLVSTIYPNSTEKQIVESCQAASAFVYVVSSYGKSGGRFDPALIAPVIAKARSIATAPIAVGFGLKTPEDHRHAYLAGADATIVGSSLTALVEKHAGDSSQLNRAWYQELSSLARAKTSTRDLEFV